jgi:hypothetical protein
MERDRIIFLRNLFFRAFLIGVLFALVFFLLTFGLWNTWSSWVISLFKIDEKELGKVVLMFFTEVRLILVFLFLVPALALHWSAKKAR